MNTQIQQVLEMFLQPAFYVQNGIVVWCNSAARGILAEGTPLAALCENDPALFSRWSREGTLQMPLIIGGTEYDASVQAMGEGDLFVASRRSQLLDATASAVVSASASLRKPLHAMVTAASDLFDQLDEPADSPTARAAAQLNQAIYQLVRLSGQMSDGGQLLLRRKRARRVPTDLTAFLAAFVQQAGPLIASAGLQLEYIPPANVIRADADTALLERALYNLLSNALNYTPQGGKITLHTERQGRLFRISITDNGEGISQQVMSTLFERFAAPGLGDSRWGIGLGLPMVREIARLHDGTMMVGKNPEGSGTTVSFSISLEPTTLDLHSNTIYYDYCGSFNHGLVELSDVLDPKMFHPVETR